MYRLSRKRLISLIGLLAMGLSLWALASIRSARRAEFDRAEHLGSAGARVYTLLQGLPSLGRFKRESRIVDHPPNSWRVTYACYYPWTDLGRHARNPEIAWQDEEWKEWDDDIHGYFCIENLRHLPRQERYAKLMALQGQDTALEFMRREGLDTLLRVAPDTLFLVEVINSTVPWMQVGDLELGEIPRTINHPDKLGIGSSFGYEKFVAGFVDGEIWEIDSSIPFAELEKLMTVEQAKKQDRKDVLGPYGTKVEIPLL